MYPHKQSRNTRIFWSSPRYRRTYSLQFTTETGHIAQRCNRLMATFSSQHFVPEMSDEPCDMSNERNCPKLGLHEFKFTCSCNMSPCVSNLKVKMRFKIKPQVISLSLQLFKSKNITLKNVFIIIYIRP